jgi:hypothetical protein
MKVSPLSITISFGLLVVLLFSAASSEQYLDENLNATTVSTLATEDSHPTNSSDDSEDTSDVDRKNFQTFCGNNAVPGCKCNGPTVTCNCKDADLPSEVSRP